MVLRSASHEDMETARMQIDKQIGLITGELEDLGNATTNVIFSGTNANKFAQALNDEVGGFVTTQQENLAIIVENIRSAMNHVVYNLGGGEVQAQLGADLKAKAAEKEIPGDGRETVDPEDLERYSRDNLIKNLDEVRDEFLRLDNVIADSLWVGPEKDKTLEFVTGEIMEKIKPAIETTRDNLQAIVEDQVSRFVD